MVMKGYFPMKFEEVREIIFPNGVLHEEKKEENNIKKEEENDFNEFEDFEVYSNIQRKKLKLKREYKYKKNEVAVYNWGKGFNLEKK